MNNPTLGEFCFPMIGRADIEESKSDVAMDAWPPQASYPCGNFSDTNADAASGKGSLGRAFAARGATEPACQGSFCPYAPRGCSVPTELPFGHLRYRIAGMPPQPNSPSPRVLGRVLPYGPRTDRVSRAVHATLVLHRRRSSQLRSGCTTAPHAATRVKLNRVFLPR